jgi:hypothetical protein
MKKTLRILAFLGLAFLLSVGPSFADAFNIRPLLSGPTFDPANLKDLFTSSISNGSLNAVTDQSSSALWTQAEGATDFYRITALLNTTGTLWIYNLANEAYALTTLGSQKTASFLIDNGGLYINNNQTDLTFGNVFGFYWQSGSLSSYTEDSKNSSSMALALSYLVKEGLKVTTQAGSGSYSVTAQGNNDWILAFDAYTSVKRNFTDAVFYVEDMKAVPEPFSMLLFGTGLVGVGGYLRRKFKK